MKTAIITVGIVGLLLGLGMLTGVLGFHYPRLIENQALEHPIKVTSLDGTVMTLEDGRRIDFEYFLGDDLKAALEDSDYQVDIEKDVENCGPEITIYCNSPRFVCGTPWAQPIRIPLIPCDIPRNIREMMGCGTEMLDLNGCDKRRIPLDHEHSVH
jgi:hypothetical protein